MTQYSYSRHLIACVMGCVSAGPAFSAPHGDATAPVQWVQESTRAAFQQQAAAPVEPFNFTVDGAFLTAPIKLKSWHESSLVEFNATVPAGEITSAGLTVVSLKGATSDTDSLARVPVTVRTLGYIRGHRIVKLQFSSMLPGHPGVSIDSATLNLQYAAPPGIAPASAQRPTDVLVSSVHEFVANPGDLDIFATPLAAVPAPAPHGAPALGDGTLDAVASFEISRRGFVQFTGADLASSGINIEQTSPGKISVWTEGRQVPVWHWPVEDESSSIAPSDRFIVYAQDNSSTYTAARRYWIKTGATATPMARRTLTSGLNQAGSSDHFTAQLQVERDVPPVLTKNDQFLSILDYRWVWWTWTADENSAALPNPQPYSKPGNVNFDLPALAKTDASSSVTLHFYAHQWNGQSPPVPFEISVNGQSIGEAIVSSADGLTQSYPVPASILKDAGNKLEILPIVTTTTAAMADICFDRMEISYPRHYDLTSDSLEFTAPASASKTITLNAPPGAFIASLKDDGPTVWGVQNSTTTAPLSVPAPAPGESFVAVTPDGIQKAALRSYSKGDDLRASTNVGDLVVIAWPDFIDALQPWLEAKRAAGYTPRVVNVFDVYDQFGYGHQSPHAIRAFLRHAAVTWRAGERGAAASSIMLVGDSTSAYRNEFRNDVINYVPTMRLEGNGGSFASDQWYASIFGDDAYADALIGRFSVNSIDDLKAIIAKQLDYQNQEAPAAWQNTLGFIADHSEFEDAVNRIMKETVPPRFFLNKVFMSELPWVDNFYFPKSIADAQQAKISIEATGQIRDMFNNGAAVVTYFGHGSPNVWSSERMWFGGDSPNSDNLLLTNRDRLPIVINMTCNSGAIDYPQPRWNVCISEDFMRTVNGGAVACFVPSGPGLTVQHERLMVEIGATLFAGRPRPLGEDLQLALWRYLADQNPPELAQMYILLGDPLMVPQLSTEAPPSAGAPPAAAPGFMMLPPAEKAGRHAQVNTYDSMMKAGDIQHLEPATRLIPLPDQAEPAPAVIALATTPADAATTQIQSTFLPVNSIKSLRLLQWKRTDDTTKDDGIATLQFRLKNESSLPVPAVQLTLQPTGCTTCTVLQTQPRPVNRLADATFEIDVPLQPGLTTYQVTLSVGQERTLLEPVPPVTVAGLRPDGPAGKSWAPTVLNPAATTVRYRYTPSGVTATVSATAFILAREPMTNLGIGLAGPDGIVAPESIVPISTVAPGASAAISLSMELPPRATSETYSLKFDPAGYFPELQRFSPFPLSLGSENYPDLAITSITSPDPSPTDGETIFFDVGLINRGRTAVDGVRVSAHRILTNGLEEKLPSQVQIDTPLVSLLPGTSETLRLRWDPFNNAGENRLRFKAESIYDTPDTNPADNEVSITARVLTKARLQKGSIHVLPPTADDLSKRQIRITAELTNTGESPARGLRVRFYGDLQMRADDNLGEADIDLIAPGETQKAAIIYKLKPGEENRKFRVTYEALYKGGRQRIPMD